MQKLASQSKAWAHRHLWQRLPRAWRRGVLFRTTKFIAPRATGVPLRLPFIVVGTFNAASGLGQSARLHYTALATRWPTYGIDLTAAMMQPSDQPFDYVDGSNLNFGTLIVHINAPLLPMALALLGHARVAGKRIIGYWAWELPEMPRDWRHGLGSVDEIWVPSTFTHDALRPNTGLPIHIMPHPLPLPARKPPHDGPFTVLTIFDVASSFERKNPLAAIRAFRQAFGDDPTTRLIVKYTHGSAYPPGVALLAEACRGATNIVLDGATVPAARIDELFDSSDVLLSLHRSEGFGLTIAEAMLKGMPVIATNWSGNVDFMDSGCGERIMYWLTPASDPQGTYNFPAMKWAEANVPNAVSSLRFLRDHPQICGLLGERARIVAEKRVGMLAYEKRIAARLYDA